VAREPAGKPIGRLAVAGEADKKGGKTLGGYELISQLGRGGMGAVYKARQTSLDRLVALKILTPSLARNADFIKRFLREARSAGKLNHPNIVTGIDVGEADGYFYFAMEFVDGESLGARLKRDGKLPPLEAVTLVRQVAEGLKHAHEHEMIHRDVKPDNIMVDSRGIAKLCDLGLARTTGADDSSLTQTGTALGTPYYISPEQARGESDVDGRADLYSLGATLYHLVSGQTPYEGKTSAVVLTRHLNDPVPDLAGVEAGAGAGLSAVVAKCMAKDAAKRYQDMAELCADLDRIASGKSPQALLSVPRRRRSPTGTGTRTTAPVDPITGRRRAVRERTETGGRVPPWILIAAGVGLLLVSAAGAWAVTRPEKGPEPVVVKEPAPPITLPEPPPEKVPHRSGHDFEKMLANAEAHFKTHPGDFDGALTRFRKVQNTEGASAHKLEAMKRADEVVAARDAAVKKAFEAMQAEAEGLKARGDYDGALAAWAKPPANIARYLRPRANRATAALRTEVEARLQKILDAANSRLAAADPGAGLKELEAAGGITYARWNGRIASMRSSLGKALKNEAELKRQQALAAARKNLEKYLGNFDVKAEKGSYADALVVVAQAGKDQKLAKDYPAELAALQKLGTGLARMAAARKKAFSDLVGQKRTFYVGREKIRGVVKKASPAEIVVEVTEKMGFGREMIYPKKIDPAKLRETTRAGLSGNFAPGSPSEHLAAAIRAFVEDDQKAMAAALTAAKTQLLTSRWTGRLEILKLGAVEAGAITAWKKLKALSEAQPGFKLTEKSATGLLAKIDAYQRDHGTTSFAASAGKEIAALKSRARSAMVTWLTVPVTALQVLGKPGTRIAFDRPNGIISITVPHDGKATVPLAINTRDFSLQFEYRGSGIEMFLRKANRNWQGCVRVQLGTGNTAVRYYPQDDRRRPRNLAAAAGGFPAGSWHRVEVTARGGALLIKVDGRVIVQDQKLTAGLRGDSYALLRDTRGDAIEFRKMKVAIAEADTATARDGGVTTGLIGNLDKRGGTFFDLQADADRKHRRFVPFPIGGRLHPGTVKLLSKDLFSCNRATVIWKLYKGERRIVAAWQQVPTAQEGVATGKVIAKMVDPGGKWAIFDLQPDGGGPLQRYAPNWGDAAILQAIKALKTGDRVKVQWKWATRRRALKIEKVQ
jgi:eukaryotic-like serine/threonine-protein kinase